MADFFKKIEQRIEAFVNLTSQVTGLTDGEVTRTFDGISNAPAKV